MQITGQALPIIICRDYPDQKSACTVQYSNSKSAPTPTSRNPRKSSSNPFATPFSFSDSYLCTLKPQSFCLDLSEPSHSLTMHCATKSALHWTSRASSSGMLHLFLVIARSFGETQDSYIFQSKRSITYPFLRQVSEGTVPARTCPEGRSV